MERDLDLRFAVRDRSGMSSSVWRAFSKGDDVYMAVRNLGGIQKFSFHRSGICRWAFTAQHGTPLSLDDRAIVKWKRSPIPAAGRGGGSLIASIAYPTDFLSSIEMPSKPILSVEAAPPGGATAIDLFLTSEPRTRVEELFANRGERRLISFVPLPGGACVALAFYHMNWDNRDLHVPGDGEVADLLFSANDPDQTGRPIRILIAPGPKDGNEMRMWELGGYAISARQGPRERP